MLSDQIPHLEEVVLELHGRSISSQPMPQPSLEVAYEAEAAREIASAPTWRTDFVHFAKWGAGDQSLLFAEVNAGKKATLSKTVGRHLHSLYGWAWRKKVLMPQDLRLGGEHHDLRRLPVRRRFEATLPRVQLVWIRPFPKDSSTTTEFYERWIEGVLARQLAAGHHFVREAPLSDSCWQRPWYQTVRREHPTVKFLRRDLCVDGCHVERDAVHPHDHGPEEHRHRNSTGYFSSLPAEVLRHVCVAAEAPHYFV